MKKLLLASFSMFFFVGLGLMVPLSSATADSPDGPLDSSTTYCDNSIPCSPTLSPALRYEKVGPAGASMNPMLHPLPEADVQTESVTDAFGYSWSSEPLNFIDASTGTNAGLSGSSYGKKTGPIPLPFTFRFYENKYDTIYIAAGGFLTFDPNAPVPWQGKVPEVTTPNNIIAPYWAPFLLAGKGTKGKVYYASGGTAPNRYFVVEWNNVLGGASTDTVGGDDSYIFEVILNENGDIRFEYKKMNFIDRYWCGIAGIENLDGFDGVITRTYCKIVKSNSAVRIVHPAAARRVELTQRSFDVYGMPGSTVAVQIKVRNTGELGADTYTPLLTNHLNWTTTLYAQDGTTPISQIGPLAEGEAVTVVVKVQIDNNVSGIAQETITFTATSQADGSQSSLSFHPTIMPDYTQIFRTFDDGAVSLDLVRNGVQTLVKVTPDDYPASYPGVLRQPNGNYVVAWEKRTCLNSSCSRETETLEYSIRDSSGAQVQGIRPLKDLGTPRKSTYQYNYGMDVIPNGSIGFAWAQEMDTASGTWNQNIWFAAADSDGNISVSPKKLTANTLYGNSSTANVPFFYNARVAGTTDNHFVVAWQQEVLQQGKWVSDVYYTVLDANGSVLKKATRFTKSVPGDGYYSPAALGLANGQVLLAFTRINSQMQELYIGTLSSSGAKTRGATRITDDGVGCYDWYYVDAAQMSGGSVILSWSAYCEHQLKLRTVGLNSNLNRIIVPMNIYSMTKLGNGAASLSAVDPQYAVLTFQDYNSAYRHSLYATAIGEDGGNWGAESVSVFLHSDTYISTSFDGLGNAP